MNCIYISRVYSATLWTKFLLNLFCLCRSCQNVRSDYVRESAHENCQEHTAGTREFTRKSTFVNLWKNLNPVQQLSRCFWSGGNHQQPRQQHCSAFGKRCGECGISGHLAACRGRARRQGRQQQSNFVDEDNGEEA